MSSGAMKGPLNSDLAVMNMKGMQPAWVRQDKQKQQDTVKRIATASSKIMDRHKGT